MKTLCVVIVALSLTSVCQPTSLACEKLLKPADKGPDLPGSWYLIAMSWQLCLATPFLNAVWPSIAVDVISKDIPNIYDVNLKVKTYGYCDNQSGSVFYKNNTMFEADSKHSVPTEKLFVMLQSGCPDCIVVKCVDYADVLMLFSRRNNVTAAELKEFETQAGCLGWSSPYVLNIDHDYENCLEDDEEFDVDILESAKFQQRLEESYAGLLKCVESYICHFAKITYEWIQQNWASFWPTR